ncbi:hypothetical protein DEH84_18100 (plasmid) [Aquabacterium olei]|jgi:hypothetical protein|uniref:Uncharacterized protein n=1 Tax=Aquabacterium olei TaxID=1296669 RepID=A0A2U8FWR0_9BURK|nr:hypothetical protein [Aquabacterium olei]AWI55499.1 hypothetical protein DEH84_18100 [Aquabacterium olei]
MKLLTASAIALILSSGSVHAAEVPDSLIEKTLGITGVKHEKVTHTKYGMTYSDVSYKTQSGELLLILRLGTAEQYAFWKQAAGPAVAPVSGVGAEGFQIKKPKSLCAKSQSTAVCATPDYFLKNPKITDEHLQAIVKAAL